MKQRIWLITGVSSGLGKAIAETAIDNGDFVIGSFRNQSQVNAFHIKYQDKAFGLLMDVTKHDEIEQSFELIKQKFGTIDILVNNAGFGFAGAIEETSITETKGIFEANFFGTLQVTQMALPIFRTQKRGHIIQISSHGGFKAFHGFGIYNASKFAVEGFSEALAAEVAPLGIKLTIVEPGPFRTNFAGNAFRQAKVMIDDYNETAGAFRQRIKAVDGKQEGDPAKASLAIFNVTNLENPPLRLPLGKIAIASLTAKINSVAKDLNDYKAVAENSVYEQGL
jgi:short-subunit dehydrogenase